jgi:hypothetical protein
MKNYFSKTLFVMLIICLFTSNLFSQGLYVTINTGYATGINSSSITNYTETSSSRSYDYVSLSFGKGVNLGGTVGYLFSRNLGVELGISYLMGGKTTGTDTYTDRIDLDTYSAKMFRINPSFVISAGLDKVNPYAKMGFVVGTGSFTHNNTETFFNGVVYLTDYKWNGNLALGFTSALGATFKLNNNISLFGELNLIGLNYSPKKMVVTKATDNGIDVLGDISTYNKETNFVSGYSVNKNNPIDYTKPNTSVIVSYPFSSFGINFGIRISLDKYLDEVRKSTN